MNEISIIDTPAFYRDNFRVRGYTFGSGKKSVCIVGPMRGNEFQQQFIAARLVSRLEQIEQAGELQEGYQILVIPSVNPYSFNTKKRFWSINNNDINRAFPGNAEGNTTKRIANQIMQATSEYEFGIHLCSFYMSGTFMPHIKIFKSEMDYIEEAKKFKMQYVQIRTPRPFEKTTLNYNWQAKNGVKAFSLYSSATDYIDRTSAHTVQRAILLFLKSLNIIKTDIPGGYESVILNSQEDIIPIRASASGFFEPKVKVGFEVSAGDTLAEIHDPYNDKIVEEIKSPADGTIFYQYSDPLVYSHSTVFNLVLKK